VRLNFNEAPGATSFQNAITATQDFSVGLGTVYPGGVGPQGQPAIIGGLGGSIWIPGATSDVRLVSAIGAFEPVGAAITVSTWLWIDSYTRGTGSTRFILKPYYPTSWTAPYQVVNLYINATGYLIFSIYTTGASYVNSAGNQYQMPIREWCLLSGTYDGAYVRLYLNGTAIATPAAQTGNIGWQTGGNAGPWVIGEPNGVTGEGTNVRQGTIWIESVARSAAYLKTLYNQGAKRY